VALIDIRNAVVLRGMLPFRQLKLVLAWCELHEEELMRNWEAARQHEEIRPVEPLE
jgi:hypothetical protein